MREESKKKTAWYVKVVLYFHDGTEVGGSINIAGYDRTSDFFDYKFQHGGNIQMLAAQDKTMVQGSRVMFGVNARNIKMWKLTHEKPTKEIS